MPEQTLYLIVAAAVVVLFLVSLVAWNTTRRRRVLLAERYGSQYQRAVEHFGSASRADKELRLRERRFEKAQLRDLAAPDRERYSALWKSVQARFVDDPGAAVEEAETLVDEVMRVRGYPAGDREQRLADVALGHPKLVEPYRSACEIAERSRVHTASTEDLRQAMVHYRALFEDLLSVPEGDLAARH